MVPVLHAAPGRTACERHFRDPRRAPRPACIERKTTFEVSKKSTYRSGSPPGLHRSDEGETAELQVNAPFRGAYLCHSTVAHALIFLSPEGKRDGRARAGVLNGLERVNVQW